MTDEELLMYQLRNPSVMALNNDHLYSIMHERMSLAADRIEGLDEELVLAQDPNPLKSLLFIAIA